MIDSLGRHRIGDWGWDGSVDDRERLRGALSELEAIWVEHDLYIREIVAPGVSEDQIRGMLAAVGLEPVQELLTWWGWHNGVTEDAPPSTGYTQIGIDHWSQLSVQDAVSIAVEMREIADEDEDDIFWRQEWLPLLTVGGADYWVVRCAEPYRGTLVVHESQLPSPPDKIDAPSLFDLVSTAIRDIRSGSVDSNVMNGWQTRPGRR